jgi:shikimate kinase
MAGQPRSIALVGLSGAGKSTVARALAQRLAMPVADSDAMLAAREGMPTAALLTARGEPAFRELEAAALADALGGAPQIVATGGGIVLREANRALLRARALVVWLDAPDTVLLARLRADDYERPLLAGDAAARLAALRAARAPRYAAVARLRISTAGLAPAEVAARIATIYRTDVL